MSQPGFWQCEDAGDTGRDLGPGKCTHCSLHCETSLQARKLYSRNPALQQLARVTVTAGPSQYLVRTQPRPGCLSTLEAGAHSLAALEVRKCVTPTSYCIYCRGGPSWCPPCWLLSLPCATPRHCQQHRGSGSGGENRYGDFYECARYSLTPLRKKSF